MKVNTNKRQLFPDLTWPQAILFVFLSATGFFLWTEHRAYLLGVLPYLIFLLCPLMHIFMHKRHSRHVGPDKHKKQLGQ